MATFASFLRPVFQASSVQHISELRPKFAMKVTPCVEVWLTSTPRSLRLGEEKKKKEEDRRRNHRAKI